MPLQRCTINGKRGWRWGTQGKCYPGKSGRAKALRQAAAIRASGFRESHADSRSRRMFDGHVLFGMQANEAADLFASAVLTDIREIQDRIILQVHESFPPQFIPQFVYQSLLSELANLTSPINSALQLIANDAAIAYPRFFRGSLRQPEQAVADLSRNRQTIFEEPDPEEEEEEEFLFLPLSFSEVLFIFSLALFANQTVTQLWTTLAASRAVYVRNRLNSILGQIVASTQPQLARVALIQELRRSVAGGRGVSPYRESVARSAANLAQSVALAAINQVTTRIARNAGITQFVWSAILDSRTCLRCLNLNGKVFNLSNGEIDGPQIPLHFLCRCLYVPVFDANVNESAIAKRDIDLTFPEWLSTLSEKMQVKILGKQRQALFASGKLSLRSFVEFRGKVPVRVKPLNELRAA